MTKACSITFLVLTAIELELELDSYFFSSQSVVVQDGIAWCTVSRAERHHW